MTTTSPDTFPGDAPENQAPLKRYYLEPETPLADDAGQPTGMSAFVKARDAVEAAALAEQQFGPDWGGFSHAEWIDPSTGQTRTATMTVKELFRELGRHLRHHHRRNR